MTTWHTELTAAFERHGETWADVVKHTMSDSELHREFDDGYGGEEGCAFTLWTRKRVYFPACYDGSEWVASVPRRPCKEATSHVGGG